MSSAPPSADGPSGPPAPPRVDPLKLAAWRAFLEAHARVTDVLGRELREQESLPLAWYDVLVQLQEAPDRRLRMQELADAVLLSKSGLTRLVDRMEREGLVRRSACLDDRRGILAELTESGYETLRRTSSTHLQGVEEHFASLLTPEEATTLTELLGRITGRAAGSGSDRPRSTPDR